MDRKKLYEGKAKILYEGPEPGTIIQYFKDEATAFNAQKRGMIDGKGALNNRISEALMLRLGDMGIPTHFIRRLNMREQLVHSCDIIPVEIIVRNQAAGSMAKRLGIEVGTKLTRPLVEFCYKSDELGDPLIADDHIQLFGWATPQEVDEMVAYSIRINDILSGLFAGIGFKLVDFKLEFGRLYRQTDQGEEMRVVLADEISPDSCRLWDLETGESFDKDRFRLDKGQVSEGYQEVARRLGVLRSENQNGGEKVLPFPNKDKS
ncbi:MAG: phosphoribosylaminoimidazolesuccinocarboxamide synthase [Alphaproteobacteria bacterium]